jgi:hypothetical protein
MNVLLLTPDAVGGTLLERLLTIYMQFHNYDKPVIEIGHLELGLEKYYCNTFNQEILRGVKIDLRRPEVYKQSTKEIIDLLESVDHYKIGKLPFYNLLRRGDKSADLAPFYQYLNENFLIISCRRTNLFDHALSWSLNKITKLLNVYEVDDKLNGFFYFYKNKVTIDPLSLIQTLNSYKKYIEWTEENFQVASYYFYEKHMPNIEEYILSLPVFSNQEKLISWEKVYGQKFNEWNKCHYYSSDLGSVALTDARTLNLLETNSQLDSSSIINKKKEIANTAIDNWNKFLQDYNTVADQSWPKIKTLDDWNNLPEYIKSECQSHDILYFLNEAIINSTELTQQTTNIAPNKLTNNSKSTLIDIIHNTHNDYFLEHRNKYTETVNSIKKMEGLGILSGPVPIKKQQLVEKKLIIKNFNECLNAYNTWIEQNPDLGSVISESDLSELIKIENSFWSDKHPQHLTTTANKYIL